jgi:hypothetical protein
VEQKDQVVPEVTKDILVLLVLRATPVPEEIQVIPAQQVLLAIPVQLAHKVM